MANKGSLGSTVDISEAVQVIPKPSKIIPGLRKGIPGGSSKGHMCELLSGVSKMPIPHFKTTQYLIFFDLTITQVVCSLSSYPFKQLEKQHQPLPI